MNLCSTPYSRMEKQQKRKCKYNLYFIGRNAGRSDTLYRIWKEARIHAVSLEFDLIDSEAYNELFENDIAVRFTEFVPYQQVVNNLLDSSCILDITQKDQSALTVRPYEAVIYNKKLLTNNKSILSFKYYDSRFMQNFEKAEDINWGWVSETIKVDYQYQDDFSPELLLEQLA